MPSFLFQLDPKEEASAALFDQVYGELHVAADKIRERGITLTDLAEKIGIDKSRVSRMLNGEANLTLRSLALLAHAMDHHWKLSLIDNNTVVENGLAGGLAIETSTENEESETPVETVFEHISSKLMVPSGRTPAARIARAYRPLDRVA